MMASKMAAQSSGHLIATEQITSLAMARHARLGAASPAAVLNADCLQNILRHVLQSHADLWRGIESVHLKTSDLVDRVEFWTWDGTRREHGGHGGQWRSPFFLCPGERIVAIRGRKGAFLDAIGFSTSLGRSISYAGRHNGGEPFAISISDPLELFDITCGTHAQGGWLTQVDEVETRESPWPSPPTPVCALWMSRVHTQKMDTILGRDADQYPYH